MEITEIISRFQSTGKMPVRESKKYSFGDYDYCKSIFKSAIKAYDKSIIELEWLPEYDEVVKWMVDNEGKGLALVGSNGRGKTSIMFGVLPIAFYSIGMVLKPRLAISLTPDIIDYLIKSWAVVLDDIGQEQVLNNYGTKIDAVEKLISVCEAELRPLFITTNLNYVQLQKRYGVRITDRINRLCKIIVFSGESFRK